MNHLILGGNILMMVQGLNSINVFKSSFQNQNSALKDIVNKINANVDKNQNFDSVELSKKAKALLKENSEVEEKEPIQKDYFLPEEVLFTKEELAEQSILFQRDGMKTLSDIIDYAKAKLEFTTAKTTELENFLNGTAPHSNPNMTKQTAEAYLHNYKQSIETDYTDIIKSFVGFDSYNADKYDKASGGLASKVMENQLNSISAESLGLANLSNDPKEIMEALENASKQVDKITAKIENTFREMTGREILKEDVRSRYIFRKNSSFDFFSSQMEKNAKIVDGGLNFNGERLKFDKSLIVDLDVKI